MKIGLDHLTSNNSNPNPSQVPKYSHSVTMLGNQTLFRAKISHTFLKMGHQFCDLYTWVFLLHYNLCSCWDATYNAQYSCFDPFWAPSVRQTQPTYTDRFIQDETTADSMAEVCIMRCCMLCNATLAFSYLCARFAITGSVFSVLVI